MAADLLGFIDTNVLVYAFDPSAGDRHRTARDLVDRGFAQRNAAVSVQVLQEFFVAITRKVEVPADVASARRGVRVLSGLTVHAPGAEDVLAAIDIHRDHGIAFWDAMIVRSAAELGCHVLWTEDLDPGQRYRGVLVDNPFV